MDINEMTNEIIADLQKENEQLKKSLHDQNERIDKLENIIRQAQQWCDAYPPEVFPGEDFEKVRKVLAGLKKLLYEED